jgi:hypothetical protein
MYNPSTGQRRWWVILFSQLDLEARILYLLITRL